MNRLVKVFVLAAVLCGCPDNPEQPQPTGTDAAVSDAQGCTSNAQCDDLDPCNGVEICSQSGSCEAGQPVESCCASNADCDDGLACNGTESCDPDQAQCTLGTPIACDDSEPCNGAELCVEGVGCVAGRALVCSDGDPCNGLEFCGGEGCTDGAPLDCDDGDACNGDETCAPDSGCEAGTPPSVTTTTCAPAPRPATRPWGA